MSGTEDGRISKKSADTKPPVFEVTGVMVVEILQSGLKASDRRKVDSAHRKAIRKSSSIRRPSLAKFTSSHNWKMAGSKVRDPVQDLIASFGAVSIGKKATHNQTAVKPKYDISNYSKSPM